MTPQEQQLLMQLTQRINQTQLQEKDPDAENLLGHELGANPDALYIMAQTVLVQNIALEQAKAQVAQLQQQVQQVQQQPQPAHTSSFLGRLLGERDEPRQAVPPPAQQQGQQGWQTVPQYQQPPQYQQAPPPQYAQPQYGQTQYVPAGQPSFLRGAMQTAAGVAAGALAFEGVESILRGFGHGGGWGPGLGGWGGGPGIGGGFGGGLGRPVEETVINNYYDDAGGAGHMGSAGGEHHVETGDAFRESAGQGAQFSDVSYDTANNASAANDQSNYGQAFENDTIAADNSVDNVQIDDSGSGFDDGSLDNGGGFDDGGGLDDGGGFDNGNF